RPGALLLQHDVVAVVGHAGTPVLLGNRHPEPPERPPLLEDVTWHPPALLPLRIGRYHLFLDEIAGELPECLMIFGEQVSTHEFPCQATSSTRVALAVPPPSHMVCSPYRIPLSRMWWAMRVISTAPDAPSGCPSAMAPPSGFSRLGSAPVPASHASGTGANASLTSKTPTSASATPALVSTFSVAGIGPVSMSTGSAPMTAPAR